MHYTSLPAENTKGGSFPQEAAPEAKTRSRDAPHSERPDTLNIETFALGDFSTTVTNQGFSDQNLPVSHCPISNYTAPAEQRGDCEKQAQPHTPPEGTRPRGAEAEPQTTKENSKEEELKQYGGEQGCPLSSRKNAAAETGNEDCKQEQATKSAKTSPKKPRCGLLPAEYKNVTPHCVKIMKKLRKQREWDKAVSMHDTRDGEVAAAFDTALRPKQDNIQVKMKGPAYILTGLHNKPQCYSFLLHFYRFEINEIQNNKRKRITGVRGELYIQGIILLIEHLNESWRKHFSANFMG